MLDKVIRELRSFEGIKRKNAIGPFVRKFVDHPDNVIASFGEDAAVIEVGEEILLLSADGIWSKLMEADPRWAGYCSILVNVHDIAGMGGNPVGLVDICTIGNQEIYDDITEGMATALKKLDVPMIGGHFNPDSQQSSIDVAILGKAEREEVIYSDRAEVGDNIIVGIDLDGRVHPSFDLNWDTTTMKESEEVRKGLNSMKRLGEKGLVNSGKDISNPGLIGTTGMLLEFSKKGGLIDLEEIPTPDDISFIEWLKMYPGVGFTVTASEENTSDVLEEFKDSGLTGKVIGEVSEDRKLNLRYEGREKTLFDFETEGITGL
ncbi:MAG: Selenophosphate synthetase-related protein [Candidatus Methanohalarchaeum thermophilum]|uniref:Selenophosphate synthetase-related protein n=1 Tax=Methanohalarchaeum thermophilum TaxID=1903181 RepID=A0A1Q6DVK5_METT1|nr:MAG: Selenophosphate synthetase-related protein [Candidatus Methanohalarchaeum thermophilum]